LVRSGKTREILLRQGAQMVEKALGVHKPRNGMSNLTNGEQSGTIEFLPEILSDETLANSN